MLVAAIALLAGGCTRKYFREASDDDIIGILAQKNQYQDWAIEHWHVYPDPRARYADPTADPDHPDRPPDDLAAHLLSPNPQPGHHTPTSSFEGNRYLKYIENWDRENRVKLAARQDRAPKLETPKPVPYSAENDTFENVLKLREQPYIITMEQAAELALFNSREFQDRREDLYLTALPVTLERFAFVTQFYATEQAIRQVSGSGDGGANNWQLNGTTGFSKLFPTGALLTTKLANQLVWDFSSGKITGVSQASLDLAQPLLRGGGWAVTLEPLTQAERNLLYAIRSYARFRKIYYSYIIGGAEIFNVPYSYAGLTQRAIGPSFVPGSQGYLPTVLLSALEKNAISNVVELGKYWKQFQAYEEGGDVSRLQVDQVEQQLLLGRSNLLQRRLDLQNGMDILKLQLGVPPPLTLQLDDQAIRPLNDLFGRFTQLREEFDEANREGTDYVDNIRKGAIYAGGGLVAPLSVNLDLRGRFAKLFTESKAVADTWFQQSIAQRWEPWRKMPTAKVVSWLEDLDKQQQGLFDEKARLEVEGKKLSPEQERKLDRLRQEINLGRFEQLLRLYEAKPWLKRSTERQWREQANYLRDVVNQYTLVLAEPREERIAKVRQSWPKLPPIQINGTELINEELEKAHTLAAQTALSQRLDLMSARAQVVDSWRQIRVTANALMGVFTVQYHLGAESPGGVNQPFNLGGSNTTNQLILNGQLPLVRRAERNAYRTALINYQRQRRALQATEDFVLNSVRNDLRQLRALAENYKIQQRSVEVAFAQVENSLDVLQAPPDPRNAAGGQTAGNAAALTQQLLNAQTSLLNAQNTLYTVWVNYLVARIQFYRDLDLLPLDSRGVWTDEYLPDDLLAGPGGPGAVERLAEPWPLNSPGPARGNELRDGGPLLPTPSQK